MRTYVNPTNNEVAVATSSSPSHHKVMITDDHGNVKETIHFTGATVGRVVGVINELGFTPSKGEMF